MRVAEGSDELMSVLLFTELLAGFTVCADSVVSEMLFVAT